MNDALKTTADGPLLVTLGIQNDGAVYALYPLSKDRILERHPGLELPRSIFLGHYKEKDFERLNRPRWEQLMVLLTGLGSEELMRLGGVRIYDQDEERVVWEWLPAKRSKRG